MTVSYGYCKLDERWLIGIVSDGEGYNPVWVWFYLGQKIRDNFTNKYWILPYEPSWYNTGKVFHIKIKSIDARGAAQQIIKIITRIKKFKKK